MPERPADFQPTVVSEPQVRVGYILKQYPRLSETFILNEILGLEGAGVEVAVFSLRHATEGRFHADVARVKSLVHYMADLDRRSFLAALEILATLPQGRLDLAMAFLDRLPADRRTRLIVNAIEIAHLVTSKGLNHLHAHFMTVAAHAAHLVHLLTGVAYSVTAHAKDIYRHTVDWEVATEVAASASAVITVCDANLHYLAHRLDGSGARLVRIYNGLDLNGPANNSIEPNGSREPTSPGLILGVGRLVEKKGFDLLLRAVDRLRSQGEGGSNLKCVIVGDGEEREKLEGLASELRLADIVTFTGALPQDQVAVWMERATVLAAPCRVAGDGNQDALPTVLLEALRAGLPAVATPIAGISEIITDGVEGVLVDCDNVAALADGLSSVLTNPDAARLMSVNGPQKVERRFDRNQTIQELVEVFQTSSVPTAADASANGSTERDESLVGR